MSHRGSTKPKGTLANAELREYRISAHASFDPLWQTGPFKGQRKAAYRWLAGMLGLPVKRTHIGMFDIPQCKRVIEVVNTSSRNLKGGDTKC